MRLCEGLMAQRSEACLLEVVAVEHVVGVEGNQTLTVRVRDVDAGFFDGAQVEGLGIDELHNEDAKEIFVIE